MTETVHARERFGVGRILIRTLAVLAARPVSIVFLWLAGAALRFLGSSLFYYPELFSGPLLQAISPALIVDTLVAALMAAFLAQFVLDLTARRGRSWWTYAKGVGSASFPIVFLTLVLVYGPSMVAQFILFRFIDPFVGEIGELVAMLLLLITGAFFFWVFTVFWLIVPVAVTERRGLGSARRSAVLTKGYRWQVFAVLLVVTALDLILEGIVEAAATPELIGSWLSRGLVLEIGWALAVSAGHVAHGIGGALIHMRLREIKEGPGMSEIAAVFD